MLRKRLKGGGRKCISIDIDHELMEWLTERRDAGVRVTGKRLRQEALRLHKEKGVCYARVKMLVRSN